MIKPASLLRLTVVLPFAVVGSQHFLAGTVKHRNGNVKSKVLPIEKGPLFENDGWPEKELKYIPKPNFSVEPTSVTISKKIEVVYENVPHSEVAKWIETIKQMHFTQELEKKSTTEYVYQGVRYGHHLEQENTWISIKYTSDGTLTIHDRY